MHPVVALERALLTASVRGSRERLEALLDPDLAEVGASGRRWARAEIIDHLVRGAPAADVGADGFHALEVAPGAVLLTFRTDPGGRPAHRSSVWRETDRGRRLVHHQETLLAADAPPGPEVGRR